MVGAAPRPPSPAAPTVRLTAGACAFLGFGRQLEHRPRVVFSLPGSVDFGRRPGPLRANPGVVMPDFDVPAGIRAGGAALWADLISGRDLAGGGVALATEACRIRDRLDDLARVIGGDVSTWITLRIPRGEDSPDVVEIVVDKALAEARQQANILRQIVAGLPVKGDDDGDPDGNEFLSGLGS